MKIFNAEKARMRALLQETPGKLSFTVDVWTSANMEPFLGITVHWIDKEWCLWRGRELERTVTSVGKNYIR